MNNDDLIDLRLIYRYKIVFLQEYMKSFYIDNDVLQISKMFSNHK